MLPGKKTNEGLFFVGAATGCNGVEKKVIGGGEVQQRSDI